MYFCEMNFTDEYFMQQAYLEAEMAFDAGEIPVGAVVVLQNKIIGKGHNLTQHLQDVTAHAEIQAITAASNYLGAKYLTDCTLYVTLEPCIMCAGAIFWAKLGTLVYGASDPKAGFLRIKESILHPKTQIKNGILEAQCSEIIQQFFLQQRKK